MLPVIKNRIFFEDDEADTDSDDGSQQCFHKPKLDLKPLMNPSNDFYRITSEIQTVR